MPHKRATRLVREQQRARQMTDLPPRISLEHEPIPKSASRVLDAGRIRREHRKKKRQLDGVNDSDEDHPRQKKRRPDLTEKKGDADMAALKIRPSETVAQFNRRVEARMMPLIRTALRQSSAQARKARREGAAKRGKQTNKARHIPPETPRKRPDPSQTTISDEIANPRNVAKEFKVASTSAPRRLNDIAQEPPEIKKLPRGATKNGAGSLGVLSMAQQAMMMEERDRAIRHYRELKARKSHESGGLKLDRGLDGNHTKGLP